MAAQKKHVVYKSVGPPTLYLIGQVDSDHVEIFDPVRGTLSPPTLAGSIANHMPYTQWEKFEEDDAAILAAAEKAEAAR